MKKDDKDKFAVLHAIADLWAKNAFAVLVWLVFLGASAKLIFFTSNWQEMTTMGAFDTVIMWVIAYYFPKKK
jgi:hypothetical protein